MYYLRTTEKTKYRPDIDGIRAIAVLSVFVFHLNPGFLPGGFLGVDVFFVISGFLITTIIQREHHLQTFSFVHFYARRVKRIFPALFVVLLLSACVATFLLPPETYVNFMKSARYASAQLANVFFSRKVGYFEEGFSGQPLLHTWSLGVEEQFYLLWPLLIFLSYRFFKRLETGRVGTDDVSSSFAVDTMDYARRDLNKKIACVLFSFAFVSFVICYFLAGTNYNLAFYMFYTRILEFFIGAFFSLRVLPVVATKNGNNFLGMAGLLLICYSIFFINEEYGGRSFLQFGVILPCAGAALLLYVNSQNSLVNRFLATAIPAGIGKISYSLYLYHWPIIIFWKIYSGRTDMGFQDSLVIISIAFLLSILSYLFVEQPARKTKCSDSIVLGSAVLVIIVFATSFKIAENYDVAEWRIEKYNDERLNHSEQNDTKCHVTKDDGVIVFECQKNRELDTPIIALVGDSHSPHFLPAVQTWAHKNDHNVKFLGTAGCPMLLGDIHTYSLIDSRHEVECAKALPLFKSEIVDDPKVDIILIAQRFDLFYDGKGYSNTIREITFKDSDGVIVKDHISYYKNQLSHTVNIIKKSGKKVIILKQVPVFNNIDACNWQPRLRELFSKERICEYDDEFITKWQQPSIDFIDNFSRRHQVEMIDPFLFFDKPIQDGVNVYRDKDHLNRYGFAFIIPYFEKAMDEIMAREYEEK